MSSRALVFGRVATLYERFRPGYPDAIVAAVSDYAGEPIRTALEIGAGTGKATRVFAAHGIAVTATEPDDAMLDVLRAHVPDAVTVVRATFEELVPTTTFDLVYAAAALHWTDPHGRWSRIAALLRPGGVVASFGGPVHLADPDLETAVRAARSPWLADDDVPPPDGSDPDDPLRWPGTELVRSPLFEDVRRIGIERRLTMTPAEYASHLSTVSAYLELSDTDRRRALDAIAAALPDVVAVRADLDLHLARRSDVQLSPPAAR